jgi:hypothetical protein
MPSVPNSCFAMGVKFYVRKAGKRFYHPDRAANGYSQKLIESVTIATNWCGLPAWRGNSYVMVRKCL